MWARCLVVRIPRRQPARWGAIISTLVSPTLKPALVTTSILFSKIYDSVSKDSTMYSKVRKPLLLHAEMSVKKILRANKKGKIASMTTRKY
jgi:hypothetical protein